MTRVVRHPGGVLRHSPPVTRRTFKGYAVSRRKYDERRRARRWDEDTRAYAELLRADPCSLSMLPGPCHEQIGVDHIVPLEGGGEDQWDNMAPACRRHNAMKKDRRLLGVMLGG